MNDRAIRHIDASTMMVEAAAMVGVRLKSISSNIFLPIVFPFMSEMKNATVASSNEARKAKTNPEAMPGVMIGKVMWKNALPRPAPQLRAASSNVGSKRCNAATTVIITNGTDRTV